MEKKLKAYAEAISSKVSPNIIVSPLTSHTAKFCLEAESHMSFPAKYTAVIEMHDDSYDVLATLISVDRAHGEHYTAVYLFEVSL